MNSAESWAQREELERKVFIKGESIIIDIGNPYEIELSRCSTYEEILGWTYHLAEKTDVTIDMIRRFIDLTGEKIGWTPHPPA